MANPLSHWGEIWLKYTGAMLWQSALVIAVVWIVARLARKRSATFRYALWMLVLVRLVLPTGLSSPVGVGTLGAQLMTRFAPSDQLSTAREEVPVQQPPVFETVESSATTIEDVATPEIGTAVPLAGDAEQWPEARDIKAVPAVNEWRLSLISALSLVWVTGVLLFSVVILWRFRALRRCLRSAEPIVCGEVHRLFSRCRESIPMSRALSPGLYSLASLSSPFAAGVLRPRIVMPQALIDRSSEAELEPLILHELVHVRRWDILVNWIQVVLQLVHWYNPLVWLANREIRRERELVCDDRVLVATGYRRKEYGSSLLKIAALTPRRAVLSLGMVGVAEPGDSLKLRLQRIMDAKRVVSVRLTVGSLLSLVLVGAVLLPAKPAAEKKASTQVAAESPQVRATVGEGSTDLAEEDYPRTIDEALAQIVNWETVTADSIEGEPHGTVVGRVLMPDNSPAAGATVSACSHRDHTMPFATTKADAAGRFQMSLPVGTCWFQARLGNYAGANGYCDAMLVVRAGGSAHEEIRILKGCEVHGRVVDKTTGAPVPGVLIVTYEGWRTVTDAEGMFRIAGVYTTDNAIFALKRDWHWPTVYFDTAGRDSVEVLVEMEPGGTVSGKVTNERGLPMAGICVDHGFSGSVWHCALRKTKTNSEGEYSLSGHDLDKGATVRVETEGYEIFYRKDIDFPPGERRVGFDIQLTATAEPRSRGGFGGGQALQPRPASRPAAVTGHHWVEGRVVAPDGAPIAGALLIAGNVRRTTDADGRFRLENLPGGAVSVRVLKGHPRATAGPLDVDRSDHVITVEPDGHVSGAVLWADTGEPVRRFKVLVTWSKNRKPDDLRNTGYQAAQHFGTTFNSPDGTFTVSALKSGSVNRVMVEVPGLRRVEKDRVIAQPVTRIEYSENIFYVNRSHTGYTFEGVVADKETGEGIESVQVTMLELDSQTLDFFSWKNNPSPYRPVSVKTDADGRFRFDTVRIRQGTLLIVKPGFARTMILDVDFRVPLNVALERGATIRGTTTDEAGRALADVDVRVANALQEHITFGSVKTDEYGRFSFADLPAGTYWVLQRDDGGSFGRHHRATISSGEMYTVDWDAPVFDPSSATPEDISMQEHLVGTWVRHTTSSSGRKVRHIEYFRDDGSWEQKLFVEGNPRPFGEKGRFAVEDGKLIILYNNGGQVSWDVTSFDRSGRMVREITRGAHTETMTKRR